MTVGLPGTGVGGLFYLLSSLAMPLRELYRRLRGRDGTARWPLVLEQTAIAAGIVLALWATGWLLGHMLGAARHLVATTRPAPAHAGNALRWTALLLGFGTLTFVLGAVEVLRLWVGRRAGPVASDLERDDGVPAPPRRVASSGGHRMGRLLLLLVFLTAADEHRMLAQTASHVSSHVARADSAYSAGNARLAEQEYAIVVAVAPDNSHATYRLAQLMRRDPAEALRLFRQYVRLEPYDAWGYMAVGDQLARSERYDDALRWYDVALKVRPMERDAVIGRARVLAKAHRTDAALAAYAGWTAAHPNDAEALSELAREQLRAGRPGDAAHSLEHAQAVAPDRAITQRLAIARGMAAPALIPLVGGSHDSDGNGTFRIGGAADFRTQNTLRLGVAGDRERVGGAGSTTGLDQVALTTGWQPAAVLRIDAAGGASRMDRAGLAGSSVTPTGEARIRWRAPALGPALDLRAQRTVLDATPLLVTNRVMKDEAALGLELPLANVLKLRAQGRAAQISDSAEVNHRTTIAGIVAVNAGPSVEISGEFHELRYAHGTTAGYFAPRLAQVAQAGSYVEVETSRGVLLALDVGLGVQRVAEQGAPIGPWKRALSLYSLLVLPVAPGHTFRLELDLEDSPIAAAVTTTGGWRYAAATLSFRSALP